ncbi:MAG: Holliday junction resolvase RuvX [Oscillospiraceae bacterium]|nr:Holliday junction resolvase RuvX [bacterium]MDY5101312.1 Holliday junction resolvase RuvX [Oscillospiraceae bacterium]
MGRVLAIDYGDQRTGLALSDMTGLLTGEAVTVQEWDAERLADRVADFALSRGAETLVLGLPKNMDGSEGPRAEKARAFAELLRQRCDLPLVFWDERRSSIEAHNILHAVGKKEKKHRATVDAVAASLLLESYLDSRR